MRVRSVYALKRCPTLEEALAYARKIKTGAGKHRDSTLEIHWDEKAKPTKLAPRSGKVFTVTVPDEGEVEQADGQWSVVVVGETQPPGGKPCAECEQTHFADDYLCPDCRSET